LRLLLTEQPLAADYKAVNFAALFDQTSILKHPLIERDHLPLLGF